MKHRIKYLPDAVADRDTIKAYLSQFYGSTSSNFFTLLKKRTEQLKAFPCSCPVYEDDHDYRVLVVGDFLVFYMVNEEQKTIEVHRIIHGSQDIRRHLKIETGAVRDVIADGNI